MLCEIKIIDSLELEETLFLRQIILHGKLGNPETPDLIVRYIQLGYLENKLIKWFKYLFNKDSELSLSQRKEILLDARKDDTMGTLLVLEMEYAKCLFLLNEDHEKIVEILLEHYWYIDVASQYILLYCLTKTNKREEIEMIENLIPEFDRSKINRKEIEKLI